MYHFYFSFESYADPLDLHSFPTRRSSDLPEPPPIPQELLKPKAPQIARPSKPPIDWEQFMGAKLFAWIGGFALFLGIAFFVKYSFEHNLIPPELRIAIGFVVGAGRSEGRRVGEG